MISPQFWSGRRVLLTGHTGFKGSWTAILLRRLGAEVYGLALPPEHSEGVFVAAGVEREVQHTLGDIRDLGVMRHVFVEARPQIVIHMAAQSLVRASYADAVGTYATNVMGTVHVLECCRQAPDLAAAVMVTSDKCYDNVGQRQGYREVDRLGGHDPYSSSKGAAELATDAYRRSFFSEDAAPSIASARAGNVIGGGDWAVDRLVPDAVRAFGAGAVLQVRNPDAVRHWQHVLDPVVGYLLLAERLAGDGAAFAEAWNFGPDGDSAVPVSELCDQLASAWGEGAAWAKTGGRYPREDVVLTVNSDKARHRLGWRAQMPLDAAVARTVEWYKAQHGGAEMRAVTLAQIDEMLARLPSVEAA